MLDEARKARIARGLRALGYEASTDNIEQISVMLDALDIYIARSETRGQLWKDFSSVDAAMHLRSKGARAQTAAGLTKDPIYQEQEQALVGLDNEIRDSALDAINYAAFVERHRQQGRYVEETNND